MTDVAGEADSAGTRATDLINEVLNRNRLTSRLNSTTSTGLTITVRLPEDINNESDVEKVTASTNYDSDNLTTTSTSHNATTMYRCEHCDSYESPSHSSLLAHIAQMHTNGPLKIITSLANNIPTQTPPRAELEPDALPSVVVENNNNNNATNNERPSRKLFECDICYMKFSNGANMRRHRMRHSGVKPYECRVCQKRFFRKDHLAEHFTTHTKTLPYHCPICNRGFQRQIAMRAHFQNEHVGQHDLVKSCPLCSYRAGSMKSLRVHFFNRHGIDLDNPGPAGSQASILAAAAAAGQLGSLDAQTMSTLQGLSVSVTNYSDSGESNRSADNATPPMAFLTPHVEISMSDAPANFSPDQKSEVTRPNQSSSADDVARTNGDCAPGSPHSADSNAPTSSLTHGDTVITPSISLIPIKQEPHADGEYLTEKVLKGLTINGPMNLTTGGGIQVHTATSSNLSSLIKVSPLKSLLRDDLKRKMAARGQPSRNRSNASPNSGGSNPDITSDACGTTTNGAITSTGPEQPSDSSVWKTVVRRGANGLLQCTYCCIGFPDQTLYFLHKGCHSDANPWKCNICGEQTSNVYEFNSHLLSKSHQ